MRQVDLEERRTAHRRARAALCGGRCRQSSSSNRAAERPAAEAVGARVKAGRHRDDLRERPPLGAAGGAAAAIGGRRRRERGRDLGVEPLGARVCCVAGGGEEGAARERQNMSSTAARARTEVNALRATERASASTFHHHPPPSRAPSPLSPTKLTTPGAPHLGCSSPRRSAARAPGAARSQRARSGMTASRSSGASVSAFAWGRFMSRLRQRKSSMFSLVRDPAVSARSGLKRPSARTTAEGGGAAAGLAAATAAVLPATSCLGEVRMRVQANPFGGANTSAGGPRERSSGNESIQRAPEAAPPPPRPLPRAAPRPRRRRRRCRCRCCGGPRRRRPSLRWRGGPAAASAPLCCVFVDRL